MKFMSHPVSKIRQHTYTTILQTLQVNYYYLFAGGWGYRKLFMKFMSHPVSKIRQHTYSTILQTIQVKYLCIMEGVCQGVVCLLVLGHHTSLDNCKERGL